MAREDSFKDKAGEELTKLPNSINGQVFYLDNLTDCTVYLLDYSAQIYADNCRNCSVYIGPVENSCFIRNCENSRFSIACGQFRATACKETTIFLYSASDPHIETSSSLKFGPYNFSYPQQDKHFRLASLNPSVNKWSTVYDHSPSPGVSHFSFLEDSEVPQESKTISGLGDPINPTKAPKKEPQISKAPNPTPPERFQSPQNFQAPVALQDPQEVPKRKEEENLNQNETKNSPGRDFQEVTTLEFTYKYPGGYIGPFYSSIHELPLEKLQQTLAEVSRLAYQANLKIRNLAVKGFLMFLGFFLLMLLVMVLNLICKWFGVVLGLGILALIIGLGAFEVIVYKRIKSINEEGKKQISKFLEWENEKQYIEHSATLEADLRFLKVKIKSK